MTESAPAAGGKRTTWVGRRIRVTIGPIAHGGHCVARHEGRVVFVRHALPGEEAVVEVTEDRSESFCRADAITILSPSPDRVSAPCRYAHPGGCGGCDFQHVGVEAQRRLKAAVIAEQFERLAALRVHVEVAALDPEDLGWRRRTRYAAAPDGRLGLRQHRSHQVLPIEQCLIAAEEIGRPPSVDERRGEVDEVELEVDDDGQIAMLALRAQNPRRHRRDRRRGGREQRQVLRAELVAGPGRLRYHAGGRDFSVSAGGFWQTHPGAAAALIDAVLGASVPRRGDRVLDLYAGAGLFTAVLAAAVGESGRVVGLEGDPTAAADGARNLAELFWSEVQATAVTGSAIRAAAARLGVVDVVVLDPPRTGAGRAVMEAVLSAEPRVICYVACDPAALARDVATARVAGWQMSSIRAFDAFPMTHHVECVAALQRGAP